MTVELRGLLDREAIRDLVNRFTAFEDRRMWDEAVDCFTEDGIFDETAVGGPRAEGREQIRALFADVDVAMTFLAHHVSAHVILEQSEYQAKGYFNCLFEGGMTDGNIVRVHSCLEDTYERVDGRWLFKTHEVRLYGPREFYKSNAEVFA